MIDLHLNFGANKVPFLSNNEIERHVDAIIADYNSELLDNPQPLNVDDFAENYLGLRMHYTNLSHRGFIWGQMVFHNAIICVYNPKFGGVDEEPVERGTVIIDNSLLADRKEHAYRSTVMHECAHWIYHGLYYSVDKSLLTNERLPYTLCSAKNIDSAIVQSRQRDDYDWIEHQAKYFSAAILMPRKAVLNVYNKPFVKDYFLETYRGYENYELARVISKVFHVSPESANIRLNSLGLFRKPKYRENRSYSRFSDYAAVQEY